MHGGSLGGLIFPGWLRHLSFKRAATPFSVGYRALQALMGHCSIVTTLRYAHLAPANLTDAVAMLDRVTA